MKDTKMFLDLQHLLNQEFKHNVMKDFFLAKLSIDLHQPRSTFKALMEPLTDYFPKSAYVLSQWAVFFYDTQSKSAEMIKKARLIYRVLDYNESSALFEELHRSFPTRLEHMDVFSNLLYLLNSVDKLCVLALECAKIDKYRPETCSVIGKERQRGE